MTDIAPFSHHAKIVSSADYVLACQSDYGVYNAPNSRCGNNQIYNAKVALTLLQAAALTQLDGKRSRRYLESVARWLATLCDVLQPDGSLALYSGHEVPLEASPGDLGPGFVSAAGGVAVVARLYEELSGDDQFRPAAQRTVDYLAGLIRRVGGFRDRNNCNQLNFSDGLPLYALHLWRHDYASAGDTVAAATDYVCHGEIWNAAGRFWKMGFGSQHGLDLETVPHPTLDLTRAWALFEMYGTRYVDQIAATLAASQQHFDRLETFYCRDGQQPADCRIRTGLAAMMATFDRFTETQTYTSGAQFAALYEWSLSLFDPAAGRFAEQFDAAGRRQYDGLPGQFLGQYLLSAGLFNPDIPGAVLAHYAPA